MIKLIKNEFIKEYTLKYIMITMILFIIISLGTYLYNIYIPLLNDPNYGLKEETYINSKRSFEDAQKRYEDEANVNTYMALKWLGRNFEATKIFYNDDNFDYNDWKYEALFQYNNDYVIKLSTLETSIAGYDISKLYNTASYTNMTMDEQKSLYKSLTSEYNKLIDIVKNSTYYEYAEFILPKLEIEYAEVKESSDSFSNKELEQTIERDKLVIKYKIKSKHDFRVTELSYLNNINELNNYQILNEDKYYLNSSLSRIYNNYNEYKESVTNKRIYLNKEIKKANYAIENNLKYHSNDFKNVTNYLITFYFIIAIFIIARSGVSFSKEQNNGSIRLLLTQGVNRNKIFISKIVNILLDIIIHYFVFIVIFIVIGSIFYNINDLFLPNINITNNNVVFSNYFIDLFTNITIVSLPIVLLSMISIFLSVITWNSVISVGMNIFINLVGIILLNLIKRGHIGSMWQYTPILYFNMSKFMYLSDLEEYDFITSTYNMSNGIIVLIIWITLFYMISRIIFNKKDIVNQ
jgi:ABC-type transport system involved in multi-copper enzyme maturation permease subunit